MNKLIQRVAILACLFAFTASFLHAYKYELSIAAITKDEDLYLKEWISYHLLVGVEHFYLYDNNDDDKTKKVLQSYIDEGIVELIPWPNKWPEIKFFEGCQVYAYQNALKKAKRKSKWLAFIDTDEFLVPKKRSTVTDVLNYSYFYKKYVCVYVNWRMFGTSHEFVDPGDPILPKLVQCSRTSNPMNKYGKTICRPEYVDTVLNVHFVETIYPYINGSGTLRKNDSIKTDLLVLNHYMYRDENFLRNVKIPRYIKMWGLKESEEQVLERFQEDNRNYSVKTNYRVIELLNGDL